MTRGSSPAAALDAWLWRHNRRPPASATSAQVTVTEGSIRIRRSGPAGASPTLVLLCDPPNMVEHYDQTLRALDACTASIMMELPGFGFSSVQRGRALEFMATVEAVEAALQQLGNGPWVLYGPCICGFVACEIARRGRVPVTGLVLAQVPDVAGMRAWCDRMDPQHRLRRPGLGQWLGRLGATRLTRPCSGSALSGASIAAVHAHGITMHGVHAKRGPSSASSSSPQHTSARSRKPSQP